MISRRKSLMLRHGLIASALVVGLGIIQQAKAQNSVYMPAILELSGTGAVSGTNFRDGMILAVEESNAKGGIRGKKIEKPLLDTQSEAGSARPHAQKVSDSKLAAN